MNIYDEKNEKENLDIFTILLDAIVSSRQLVDEWQENYNNLIKKLFDIGIDKKTLDPASIEVLKTIIKKGPPSQIERRLKLLEI